MRSVGHVAALLVATGVLVGAGLSRPGPPVWATTGSAGPVGATVLPIHHVVEIMLENHTFDNLFGYFPGANGIPAGTTFPSPFGKGEKVSPLLAPPDQGSVGPNLDNSRPIELVAMDRKPDGDFAMDHYTITPYEGLASITVFPPSVDPNLQFLAKHYALAESNFQPEIAPTLPNVLAALSGTSDGWYTNDTPPSSDRFYTIFDELQHAGHSWQVFNGADPPAAGTIWGHLVPAGMTDNVVGASRFITEATKGTLPNFSFVRPGGGYSEESPEDTSLGDAWLGQLVLAVMKGPDWPSTVIFFTYDEGGGFWDHVPPPQVNAAGYGTRTPMVVISAYTAPQLISQTTTNLSVLSFMQELWHLRALNITNLRAPDLFKYFDFSELPRPPALPPAAPPATLLLQETGPGAYYYTAAVDRPVTITVAAQTPGLTHDVALNGLVRLSVIGPKGAPAAGVPRLVLLKGGYGFFTARFPTYGYWRIKAMGPERSPGWITVGVGGVNADTP